MIVTGLFLAEKAAVVDGKLNVWGGILDHWNVKADRWAEFNLVILVQAEPADTDWTIALELRAPSGEVITLPPTSVFAEGGEHRFACPQMGGQFPHDGRHVIIATAKSATGESSASVAFEVRS